MALKIITADERAKATRVITALIVGPYKIGKTRLVLTLPPEDTLFANMEAGDLSIQEWKGDEIKIRSWEQARDLMCLACGPDPSMRPDQSYSQDHFDHVSEELGGFLDKYKSIFWDSLTDASRLALQWAKGQPQAFSEKTGKPDVRGAYGLLAQELITWARHAQRSQNKNAFLVGLLDKKKDEYGRITWELQIEGAKSGLEIPGIIDQVISMVELKTDEGETYVAFVCKRPNKDGYPAGDRSGKLDMIEQPHLGKLIKKIIGSPQKGGKT